MFRFRKLSLIVVDTVLIAASFWLALLVRYDWQIPAVYQNALLRHLPILIAIKVVIFALMRMYNIYWGYASIRELFLVLVSTAVANIVTTGYFMGFMSGMPRGMLPIVWLSDMFFLGGVRYLIRTQFSLRGRAIPSMDEMSRTLIIGAGEAGAIVVQELRKNPKILKSIPVAFIDDDPQKHNILIKGVRVMGSRQEIGKVVRDMSIDQIIIALPSATQQDRVEILNLARATGVKTKIIPGVYEMIDGSFKISEIREVQIEDLLGRDPIVLDTTGVSHFLQGKTVLITGGGGSIGSELARQIAKYKPGKLVLLDIYENCVYDVQQEFKWNHPEIPLSIHIDSVRDEERIKQVLEEEKPQVVFHAAAHKHVPLMEKSVTSAIKNNIFGTYNMAKLSVEAGVERFVLISTDKAVRPTNVMGATKAFCENIVNAFNTLQKTEFVAVRFGNVLGSSGSVIPLFTKQIKQGGPVTVTDPRITRFFMTIPEAAQLVLQAGAMAKGGEIFILDMGDEMKIAKVAEDLIRLSGFEPGKDIKIEYTGLRPGEKLYEELLVDKKTSTQTAHEKIYVEVPEVYPMEKLTFWLHGFIEAIDSRDSELLVKELRKAVPSYDPNRV